MDHEREDLDKKRIASCLLISKIHLGALVDIFKYKITTHIWGHLAIETNATPSMKDNEEKRYVILSNKSLKLINHNYYMYG